MFSDRIFRLQNYQKEFEEINEQLLRLETLSLIDMYECDLQWQKFVNHTNLITYCFKFFETVSVDAFDGDNLSSLKRLSYAGHIESMFDLAPACIQHSAQFERVHGAEDDEYNSAACVTVRYNSVDETLSADRYEGPSASAADIGRMVDTEDHILSIAERLARNRSRVWEQHFPNIR